MSDHDSGNGDRATIALAVEKIGHLHELTRAEFGGVGREFLEVKSRLDKLEGLPERVVRLESQMESLQGLPRRVDGNTTTLTNHESRILATERARDESVRVADEDRRFHRIHWPTFLMAAIAVAVAAGPLFIK